MILIVLSSKWFVNINYISVTEIKFQISPTGPTNSWTGLALFRIEVCLVAVH